jgi:hypothetical protein
MAQSPLPEKDGMVPTVLCWGNASPMAVHRSHQREVLYPDGLVLAIKLSEEITLVETIRVTAGNKAEHMFHLSTDPACKSDFHSARVAAFEQIIARISPHKKLAPPKRSVIFGTTHVSVQQGIRERHFVQSKKKKQVQWGDKASEPAETPYGGWGLIKIREIPNRYEQGSCSDEEEMEDDDFELLFDEEGGEEEVQDAEEEEEEPVMMEAPEQELVDESEEDEEEEQHSASPRNKKMRMMPSSSLDEDEQLIVEQVVDDVVPCSPPPVTASVLSLEEEIKAFDMWLLQNDVNVI